MHSLILVTGSWLAQIDAANIDAANVDPTNLAAGAQNVANVEPNALLCSAANNGFLITVITLSIAIGLIFFLIKLFILDRRFIGSPGVRVFLCALFAVITSSAIITWNPFKNEMYQACLENPEFARFMTLGNVPPLAKGLILGGAVAFGGYLLFLIILAIIMKLRKK